MTGDAAVSVDAASSDDEGDGETYENVPLEHPTPGRELVLSLQLLSLSCSQHLC